MAILIGREEGLPLDSLSWVVAKFLEADLVGGGERGFGGLWRFGKGWGLWSERVTM
jgi:hypothetical protein